MYAESVTKSGQADREDAVAPPLVVDLDGTLVKADLLIESVLSILRTKPWRLAVLPLSLAKGKARFKREVARYASVDIPVLPWRREVVAYIKKEREQGRTIVLATASDESLAQKVVDHLNLFDEVLASDGNVNLAGEAKRTALVRRLGEKGFDYVADGARGDLFVWAAARKAILVNPTSRVLLAADRGASIERIFTNPARTLVGWVEPLRPAHWLKNLLLFVPLLAAHRMRDFALLEKSLLAFAAFACCASAGYLFNDLIDLEADRHHPHKRFRAFAAGTLPLTYAFAMIPLLVLAGGFLAAWVGPLFLATLMAYFTLSGAYTSRIKHIAILDVLFLAGLYSVRILAGSAATGVWISHWLLAFSTFLFFSLALVKRYAELVVMRDIDGARATARGYELGDAELLAAMGTASGYLAVLVLAFYIASQKAVQLYGRPEVLWFLCPVLLYWISHIWLTAHRGKMHDDPLVFALGDRTSRILMAVMLATAAAASP